MFTYDLRQVIAIVAIIATILCYFYYRRKPGLSKTDKLFLHVLGGFVTIYLACVTCGPFFVKVDGHSMEPTFHNGEELHSIGYWAQRPFYNLQRGDVVTLNYRGETMVKRVYAVAGDKFWLIVYHYGNRTEAQLLSASQLAKLTALKSRLPSDCELIHFTVNQGCVYLLGDNLLVSEDSRVYGEVPLSNIVARVIPNRTDQNIEKPPAPD